MKILLILLAMTVSAPMVHADTKKVVAKKTEKTVKKTEKAAKKKLTKAEIESRYIAETQAATQRYQEAMAKLKEKPAAVAKTSKKSKKATRSIASDQAVMDFGGNDVVKKTTGKKQTAKKPSAKKAN
jgi:hypothetical protein